MGAGKRIEIRRDGAGLTIRDYGRGIPLGKLVDCVSQINTGGKYSDEVFQFSVGLNGVGTKAVNALSQRFSVTSWREGKFRRASFAARQDRERQERQGRGRPRRHRGLVRARPRDLRPLRVERGVHHRPAPLLRVPERRPDARVPGQALRLAGRPRGSARARDGRRGPALPARARTGRATRVRLHPHPRLRRDLLLVRQRPVHQRRRHPPERIPRGRPEGGERVLRQVVRGRGRARRHRRRRRDQDPGSPLRLADEDQARLGRARLDRARREGPRGALAARAQGRGREAAREGPPERARAEGAERGQEGRARARQEGRDPDPEAHRLPPALSTTRRRSAARSRRSS